MRVMPTGVHDTVVGRGKVEVRAIFLNGQGVHVGAQHQAFTRACSFNVDDQSRSRHMLNVFQPALPKLALDQLLRRVFLIRQLRVLMNSAPNLDHFRGQRIGYFGWRLDHVFGLE